MEKQPPPTNFRLRAQIGAPRLGKSLWVIPHHYRSMEGWNHIGKGVHFGSEKSSSKWPCDGAFFFGNAIDKNDLSRTFWYLF